MRSALLVVIAGCGRVGFDAAVPAADASVDIDVDTLPDAPTGAVLHLAFDTAPSGSMVEDSARGHAVSCRTTCPTLVPGVRGNAYLFEETNPDVLLAPYVPDLDPSAGFTLAVWIRMNALPPGPYYCVLGKPVGAAGFNSHALCVDSTGNAFYHSGTVAGTDNLTGSAMSILSWHHLAMTWDGATKRGYLDGIPDGTRSVSVENDTNPISVGADLNSGNPAYPMDGALDEVWVFDRPLDPAEIAALATP